MNAPQELIILENFVSILEELGISYAVGGSIASSVYGKVRFTQDADITVAPFENIADELFKKLEPEYYISRDAMYQALAEHTSFNVIHFESAFKIDIFVCKNSDFEKHDANWYCIRNILIFLGPVDDYDIFLLLY